MANNDNDIEITIGNNRNIDVKVNNGGGGSTTIVQADWNETDPSDSSYIKNKPTIPSKTSDLSNDSGFIDNTYHDNTKLDKVTTTTGVLQAYVKQTNGTQQMLDVHWNNVPDTLPIRDQTGNIRVALTPTNNTHATSKQYVDNAIASVRLYNHYIEATFVDGCNSELKGIFKFVSSSDTPLNSTTFKAMFNKQIDVSNYPDLKCMGIMCEQSILNYDTLYSCKYLYNSASDYFSNETYYTQSLYSSGLTLQSLTDTVSNV